MTLQNGFLHNVFQYLTAAVGGTIKHTDPIKFIMVGGLSQVDEAILFFCVAVRVNFVRKLITFQVFEDFTRVDVVGHEHFLPNHS